MLVNQDWQKAEYAGVGKKDFIQFSFEFTHDNLSPKLLPQQYEGTSNFQDFRFEIAARIAFDDLENMQLIAYNDFEVMGYKSNQYLKRLRHSELYYARPSRKREKVQEWS